MTPSQTRGPVDAYTEAQKIIVENGLAVPLRFDQMIAAMHDYVKGWAMNDLGFQPRLYDVWLDKSRASSQGAPDRRR